MPRENDGIMIILSSPSGAGKTTLVSLLSKLDNFEISISHTTRKPRANEIPNKNYYFVDEVEFKRIIKNQEFLEYAKVFNNFYGSTKTPVIKNLNKGKNVLADGAQGTLLDIDFGSYPFVTSSNTTTAGACIGLGVSPKKVEKVYGVFKAYLSLIHI